MTGRRGGGEGWAMLRRRGVGGERLACVGGKAARVRGRKRRGWTEVPSQAGTGVFQSHLEPCPLASLSGDVHIPTCRGLRVEERPGVLPGSPWQDDINHSPGKLQLARGNADMLH